MADDDDQPPTLPGFEHLRPVAVVKDDAGPQYDYDGMDEPF